MGRRELGAASSAEKGCSWGCSQGRITWLPPQHTVYFPPQGHMYTEPHSNRFTPIHPHHEPGLGLGPCISHLSIVTPFWLTRSLGCKPMMFLQSTSDHIDSHKTPPRLPSPLSTVFEGLWSSCWQPLCPVPHDTERVHSTSPQNMTSGIGLFFAVFKSRHRTKSGLLLSAEEQGDAQSPGDNTRLISPKMAPEEST